MISRNVPDGWRLVGAFTSWGKAYDYATMLADEGGQIVEWFIEDQAGYPAD